MTPPAGELSIYRVLSLVKEAGGLNPVVDTHLMVWWTDPETRSTLTLYLDQILTIDDIRRHMEASRAKFAKGAVRP